jgi:hypothetical protein
MNPDLNQCLSEVFRNDLKRPVDENLRNQFAFLLRPKEDKKTDPFIVDGKFHLGLDEIA